MSSSTSSYSAPAAPGQPGAPAKMTTKKIKALLVDLSGTLHVGGRALPRARRAVDLLREHEVPLRFVSNTTKDSRATLLAKLERCALDVRPHELLTSLSATRTLAIDKLKLQRPLLLLSDDARRDFPHPELAHEHEHEQKEGDEQSFDGVVVGLAPERMDYAHLNLAFRVLTREQRQTAATATSTSTSTSTAKPPLLATHTARYFQSPDGQLSLGPGGFVRALELASGAQAQVVGKPERAFYELALGTLAAPGANEGGAGIEGEVDWGHVAMVGDDVVQDVGEGVAALGLQRFLVRTGKYRSGDEDRMAPGGVCCDDFAAVARIVLQSRGVEIDGQDGQEFDR